MGTFHRFEELEVWRRSRVLAKEIYECTRTKEFARDPGLRNQIRRAAVSTMSNIAEGSERGGNSEFIHFLGIAKGSVGEVRSQLFVAYDQNYISQERFEELTSFAAEISRMLSGLIKYLKKCGIRGTKFKDPKDPQ